MRRPRQRRRCSARVERASPRVRPRWLWLGRARARDPAAHYLCVWPWPRPHRTRPHDAVRTPGSDSVVMHVAGQFDPRAMGPPPRRFTGRHMLRSHIAVEVLAGLAEGIATPAGLMPRPRSTIPLPFQSRCQPIPSSLRSNESQLIFMQTKGVDRSHSRHKRERQSACEAQPPTHHTPPLDLTFAHTFLDRTQCV